MVVLLNILEQTCLFLPLVIGIYFSYKILGTTDLTVDGSFVLGAGSFARLVSIGVASHWSFVLALLLGFFAGLGVAVIQKGNRINSLIAGILALFILYSINFQVMGRPNISLQFSESLVTHFNALGEHAEFTLVLMIAALSLSFMIFLLKTRLGIIFRAFGDNPSLLKILGKNPDHYKMLGLALSNLLAALCGVITAEINGYADLNMGFGVTLTGIGAVVIGCEIIRRIRKTETFSIVRDLLGCFVGTLLYFSALNFFLMMGIDAIHLRLVLGIILVILLRLACNQQSTLTTSFKRS